MALQIKVIKCIELQEHLDRLGDKIKHIVHCPQQCAIGVLTDRMILVIERPDP